MKKLLPAFLGAGVAMFSLSAILSAQSFAQSGNHQSAQSSTYKLLAVKVTGSKRFTEHEIALASGLPVGTVAHEEDFQKAARQLGETGAFGNISFSYTYSGEGTKLIFQVTDADKFVPVHFADFVWFSDEDLIQRLHERIPLFNGELPTSGRMTGQVSDVLQAMLVQNAVPGQVEYTRAEDKDGKLQAIDYNVVGVSIRIHHADFPGAGPGELPMLEELAEKLIDREYSRAYMSNFVDHSLLPIYRQRGFLKASCDTPQPKVVKSANAEALHNGLPPTFVDVTFPVTPGAQYKIGSWEWSGNKVIPNDELQPLLHVKVGQIANTVELGDDLHSVQELYGSRGYVLATVRVDATFNDAAGTVAFRLIVNEDSLFHMGELEFRGLDNSLTARLQAAWKLRPGDVYDASYLQQFLPLARKLLPPALDWDVTPHVTAIKQENTVDVDLQYTAKAPK
jgi:outer membrane protein assembly factor BamA